MKFVTFYTAGYYEQVFAENLQATALKFNVPITGIRVENSGDWDKNTRMKARIVAEAMEQLSDDITIIDADAQFIGYPILLEQIPSEYDIAFHYFDWWKHFRKVEGNPYRQLLSGTLMIRNNSVGRDLLEKWIRMNETQKGIYEQQVLQELIETTYKSIKIFNLPFEYCCVADHSGNVPSYCTDPKIFHTQVSRKIKANKALLQ